MSPVLALSCLLLLGACAPSALAAYYDKCKLASKLENVYGFPSDQISTWICIIHHESRFQMDAVSRDSQGNNDYGLFQINSRYWCDQGGSGCGVSCKSLTKSLSKSVRCAKVVYNERGFEAWTAYRQHCRGNTYSYIEDC